MGTRLKLVFRWSLVSGVVPSTVPSVPACLTSRPTTWHRHSSSSHSPLGPADTCRRSNTLQPLVML